MFSHTYYYKVYNTWCTPLLGPKPDDVNHIYGTYTMEREKPFTEAEIELGRNAITKAFVGADPDVSPEDVVFITKEEYEANTDPDKGAGFKWSSEDKTMYQYNIQ